MQDDIVKLLPYLGKFAFKLTGNKANAEDLVHDVVVKALEKQHMFDGLNLKGWLGVIMYNMFITKNRRSIKFETQYDPETFYDKLISKPVQEDMMFVRNVQDAIDKLSKKHKEVLMLHAFSPYDIMEQAVLLNIPNGTQKSRLNRAKTHLKYLMGV